MKIEINRNDKTPVYMQIAGQIKGMLHTGELTDGYMLPSERTLAAELGVHRNTVTRAYGELKSEGLLDSSQGSCYRVRFGRSAEDNSPDRRKNVNWEAAVKQEYDEFISDFDELYSESFDPAYISFAGGVAAREPYPPEEIAAVFEEMFRSSGDKAYFYVPYQGDPELIREIVKYMASIGIRTKPSNIQIFSENNQALDFILQLMLSPGDGVIVDEVMASDVYRTIELAGGKLLTVPSDEHGMITDHLDKVIESSKPKFIYVDSSFNNPKGTVLSLERRRKILELYLLRRTAAAVDQIHGSRRQCHLHVLLLAEHGARHRRVFRGSGQEDHRTVFEHGVPARRQPGLGGPDGHAPVYEERNLPGTARGFPEHLQKQTGPDVQEAGSARRAIRAAVHQTGRRRVPLGKAAGAHGLAGSAAAGTEEGTDIHARVRVLSAKTDGCTVLPAQLLLSDGGGNRKGDGRPRRLPLQLAQEITRILALCLEYTL